MFDELSYNPDMSSMFGFDHSRRHIWPIIIGAAIGAGVGEMGNAGGWKKGAMYGAGAGAGYMAIGGMAGGGATAGGSAGGTGAKTSTSFAPNLMSSQVFNTASPYAAGAGAGGGGGGFGAMAGKLGSYLSNPGNLAMLGQAGMGLAAASSAQGPAFQQNVPMSAEGKKLQKKTVSSVRGRFEKATAGNVGDKAFAGMAKARTAEGTRERATRGAFSSTLATMGNVDFGQRGVAAMGGRLATETYRSANESMRGLFGVQSHLNNVSREELFNSIKGVQNMSNIDNQVAAFQHSSQMADFLVNQKLGIDRGAAFGNVFSMVGRQALNESYLNKINSISSMSTS